VRRINLISVEKPNKQITKSFFSEQELLDYIDDVNSPVNEFILKFNKNICKTIWNLNVGSDIIYGKVRFAMAGKTRVGNYITF